MTAHAGFRAALGAAVVAVAAAAAVAASVAAGVGFGAALGAASAAAEEAVVETVEVVFSTARAANRSAVPAAVAGLVGCGEGGTQEPRFEAWEAGLQSFSSFRILRRSSSCSQLSFNSVKELGSGGKCRVLVCEAGVDGDWLGGVTDGMATTRVPDLNAAMKAAAGLRGDIEASVGSVRERIQRPTGVAEAAVVAAGVVA